jgi:signal peptidase I
MTQPATPPASEPKSVGKPEEEKETLGSFLKFVLKLAVLVLVFRSFLFSPFNIPSESMLPGLWNGDYLLAAKWPYGFSRHSLPFDLPLIPGRIFASQPQRGDVVIFKHPVDGVDYIKRVIGLPGDTVQLVHGQVVLNGTPVPKQRIADFDLPQSPNTACAWGGYRHPSTEGQVCTYARFRETLPGGKSYNVLDFGPTPQDDWGPAIVPQGTLFLMGDNRDNSQDSRFPALPGGGVGFVPQGDLVGRASVMMWSTDGSVVWYEPWTWFTAARWSRIGRGI